MLLDLFKMFLALLFIGVVIKYMDDLTDGEGNFEHFPYYLLLLTCSVLLDKNLAIPCLWAAYAIGMADKLKVHYIFNLNGILEGIIVSIVGAVIFHPLNFVFFLVLMFFINLTDDLIDFKTDEFGKNFAKKYGVIEVILLSLNLLAVLIYLDYEVTLLALVAYTGIQIFHYYRGNLYDGENNSNIHSR